MIRLKTNKEIEKKHLRFVVWSVFWASALLRFRDSFDRRLKNSFVHEREDGKPYVNIQAGSVFP